jgi:hypothetical protein
MTYENHLAYTLFLIGIATMTGSSLKAGGEHVAPE